MPTPAETVIEALTQAFAALAFPGAAYLFGSLEGDEPEQEVGPFQAFDHWQGLDPSFLDAHASSLSFFSEAGFRFFLPAYLVADVRGQLQTADPLFHLTNGFYSVEVQAPVGAQTFTLKSGKATLINPLRYGAMTAEDYARYRLSVFTRQEASAIVAYLRFKRDADPDGMDQDRINAALEAFWIPRSQSAPTTEALGQHVAEQNAFVAAIQAQTKGGNGTL